MQPAPMLADPIDKGELPRLCHDDSVSMELKADGRRILVVIDHGQICTLNRSGEPTSVPPPVINALSGSPIDGVFDGELVTDSGHPTLWLFDMPEFSSPAGVVDGAPHYMRRLTLEALWGTHQTPVLRVLPCARTTEEKLELVHRVLTVHAEGVIVKDNEGLYRYGRRGPGIWKAKIVQTVDAIVVDFGRHDHDNATLAVYRDGELVEIGEVSCLTGDGPRLRLNDVVEVRYLYVTPDNRLYQPTKPLLRTDKSRFQCDWDQLVFGTKDVEAVIAAP